MYLGNYAWTFIWLKPTQIWNNYFRFCMFLWVHSKSYIWLTEICWLFGRGRVGRFWWHLEIGLSYLNYIKAIMIIYWYIINIKVWFKFVKVELLFFFILIYMKKKRRYSVYAFLFSPVGDSLCCNIVRIFTKLKTNKRVLAPC